MASNVPWLTATPAAGALAANSQQSLTISADALNLTAGTYSSKLTRAKNRSQRRASFDYFGRSLSLYDDMLLVFQYSLKEA